MTVGVAQVTRSIAAPFRKSVMLVCLAVLLSLTGGCSVTRTAYNQIDWVLTYYLAKHFELDKEQKAELRTMVDRNLAWHRTTQLPRYAAYLREVEAALDEPVTYEQLRASYEQTLDFWDASMLHIVPDAQTFLSNLTDEQVEQMIARMEENNDEMFDEYSGDTEEKRAKNRDKNTIKFVERLFGKLNDEQKQAISDRLAGMEDATEDWIANRRRWQAAFIELVQERPPEAEYRERLTELYVYPRRFDEPEFQKTVDENLDSAINMMVELMNSLTPAQRKKAQKRFRNFAEDFDALAAQGKKSG